MKKIAAALTAAGLSLFGVAFMAAPVGATQPDDNGFHKVTICHNVSHNPHAISIDVASVAGSQETKHGLLVLDENLDFVSFTPHQSGGHDQDFYLHNGAENKPEDDLACQPVVTTTTVPPTTTTTAPVVTTTTQPPVTTTTQPPVTTTTEPPAVTGKQCVTPEGFAYTTSLSECPTAPVAETPVVTQTPITALPHTGAWSLFLALLGTAAGLTGLGLMLFSRSLRRTEES